MSTSLLGTATAGGVLWVEGAKGLAGSKDYLAISRRANRASEAAIAVRVCSKVSLCVGSCLKGDVDGLP